MTRAIGKATVGGLTMSLGLLAFPEAASAAPPTPPAPASARRAAPPTPAVTRPGPAAGSSAAPGRTPGAAAAQGQARAAAARRVPAAAATRSNRPGSVNRATGQARAEGVQALNAAAAAQREAGPAATPAGPPTDAGGGQPKVLLCHVTSSDTNPFSLIEIAEPAAVHAHLGHGDVAPVDGTCPSAIVTPPAGETVTICTRTGIAGSPFALTTVTADELPALLAQGAVAPVGGVCPGPVVLSEEQTPVVVPTAPTGRVLVAIREATPARVEQQLLSNRVRVAENRGALPVTGVEVGSLVIVGLAMIVAGGRLARSGRLRTASTSSTASA